MFKKPRYLATGHKDTPDPVLRLLRESVASLSSDWVLRTQHLTPVDLVLEREASKHEGELEIYLPWDNYISDRPEKGYIVPKLHEQHFEIVKRLIPGYAFTSTNVRRLLARSVCQLLGQDLKTPVACLLCWYPTKSESTGSIVNLAEACGVSVFNLNETDALASAKTFFDNYKEVDKGDSASKEV